MYKNKQKGGIIKFLIILVSVIALASFFFNFSVQEVVENQQTQENFTYISNNITNIYSMYIAPTVRYLWNDIFIDLIWNNFTQDLSSMKEGESTLFEKFSPQVKLSE